MVLSTKTKLVALIACSLLVLAVGAGFFSFFSVERTMGEKQRESCVNAVSLAALNAMDRYQALFREKATDAVEVRQRLNLLVQMLAGFGKAQSDYLMFLKNFPQLQGISITAMDSEYNLCFANGELAFETNPYLQHDIKGRQVGPTMDRRARAGNPATSLVLWREQDGRERRFFGTHFYMKRPDLTVSVWLNIDHMDKKHAQSYVYAIEDLQKNFADIHIGPSGFIFIVDGKGRVIVGPKDMNLEPWLAEIHAPDTLRLIDRLKTAKADIKIPVETIMPGRNNKKETKDALLFVKYVKPFDWYVTGVAYIDEVRDPGQRLSLFLIGGICVAALFVLLAAVTFARRLTSPLVQLAQYARTLPDRDFMKDSPPPAALTSLSAGRHGDEVENLAQSFLFMEQELQLRVRELMDATSSRERLEGELMAAKEIQMGFLPKPLPPAVSSVRFALAASLVPAREVGGDLYDFFMLDERRLCFVIGDVSDKGVPASLFMSMTLTLVRSSAASAGSPDKLMTLVNANLSRDNPKCMFVTLFIGILDLLTGEVQYANGGHNPPLLLSPQGEPVWLEAISGPVVGVMEDIDYKLLSVRICPGDILFLYTDGLNEAMNSCNEMYSNERMFAALAACRLRDVDKVLQHMLHDVEAYVGDTPASDDMTVLCLQYLGQGTVEQKNNASDSCRTEELTHE